MLSSRLASLLKYNLDVLKKPEIPQTILEGSDWTDSTPTVNGCVLTCDAKNIVSQLMRTYPTKKKKGGTTNFESQEYESSRPKKIS